MKELILRESWHNINIKKVLFKYKRFHCPNKPFLDLSEKQLELVREFNKKIRKREISFEVVPCLCGNTEFDLIAGIDRYSLLMMLFEL